MNIKRIIAHNFMSYKHVEVDLHKNLNVIVGESDSGKTTLFKRAIRWCLFNDLIGDYYVRDNDEGKVDKKGVLIKENECYVTIIFDNDAEITRKRVKSKNIYEVTDENGEYFPFENFGKTVPDKVIEVFGIKKEMIDKDVSLNLNIPEKKELSVLYMSNGTKAKVVGSFAGTHVIDAAIRDVQADTRNNSSKINYLEGEIETLESELNGFNDITAVEELISKGDKIIADMNLLNDNINKTNTIAATIKEYESSIEQMNRIISSKENIEKEEESLGNIINRVKEIQAFKEKYNYLIELSSSIKSKKEKINDCTKIINEKAKLLEIENDILTYENRLGKLDFKTREINDKKKKIVELAAKINVYSDTIKKCDSMLQFKNEVEKEYTDILKHEIRVKDLSDKIKSSKEEFILIKDIKRNMSNSQSNLLALDDIIKEKSNLLNKERDLCTLEERIDKISKSKDKKEKKLEVVIPITESLKMKKEKEEKGVPILNKMKNNLSLLIQSYIKDVKELGKCPICLSQLTSEHLSNIENELLS